ncbi:hypothetical protein L596_030875 [Steinernema carpocapsae]|uniref:Uncharacterized protein n=1 Tax=Steinernema carpocapsae TaxID=34508 RepID=A0A4U5LNE7_STECR|nr:hypothetical protein L596_030875 [Steinernema carpocapsae]
MTLICKFSYQQQQTVTCHISDNKTNVGCEVFGGQVDSRVITERKAWKVARTALQEIKLNNLNNNDEYKRRCSFFVAKHVAKDFSFEGVNLSVQKDIQIAHVIHVVVSQYEVTDILRSEAVGSKT